ncbi:MAG: response regulator transcription factor [Flavobacteriales bacterium]|nr:response regulator transcription factor [Flavobacteriales bacterium]
MEKHKILLVEDDLSFGSILKDYLMIKDFDVTHAINGEDGLSKFKQKEYDICILDVMMPKKDGFTLAKEIKELNSKTPIVFLTAKDMREDVLKGYKIGADDYITKPFDSELLLYKIKAIIQRNFKSEDENEEYLFRISDFTFDSKMRILTINSKSEKLSPKENELLKMLCINKDDILYRDEALRKIWKKDNYFSSRSMDVYIAKLRKILKQDKNVEIINIHGEGFRLLVNKQ